MEKKLFRSKSERIFAGVCGGIGEYMKINPNIVRFLFAIFTVTGNGFGIFIYIVIMLFVPEKGENKNMIEKIKNKDYKDLEILKSQIKPNTEKISKIFQNRVQKQEKIKDLRGINLNKQGNKVLFVIGITFLSVGLILFLKNFDDISIQNFPTISIVLMIIGAFLIKKG